MFKTIYQKLGLAVLFLAVLAMAMVGFMGIAASAEEETSYSLSVTIPSDANHGKVYLTVGSGAPTEVVSGKTYTITRGVVFALSATSNPGYRVQWFNNTTGYESVQLNGPAGENMDYTASFVAIPYNINYVDEGAGEYYFPNGVVRTHTYNTETTIINPIRGGYTLSGWYLYNEDPTGKELEASLLPADLTLGKQQTTQDIWLKPVWKGIEYAVIRLDCVFEAGKPFNLAECLGYQILAGEMGSYVDGTLGEATLYRGYSFHSEYDYEGHRIPVTISYTFAEANGIDVDQIIGNPSEEGYNVIFRYYLPKSYTITPDLNAGDDTVTYKDGAVMPSKHVFNENTGIPDPVREGYTFQYWTVSVNGTEVKKGYSGFILAAKEYDGEITLTANWKANEYNINYNWNGKDAGDNNAIAAQNSLLLTQYKIYTYDTAPVGMPYPIRRGYTFNGWIVSIDGANPYDGPVKDLPAELFSMKPTDITLTAQWTANVYTVTLDGNGATAAGSPGSLTVTYDAALDTTGLVIPKRFGYTFLGYFTATTGGDQYINADGSSACNAWDLAADTTLYAQWEMLPQVAAPAFGVDYINEHFVVAGGIPVGHYEFSFGETLLDVVVTSSSITVNGHIVTAISIPEEFFGQTVELMVHGDGETTSHNYVNLKVEARPKAPELHKEIKDISENYTQIEVILMDNLPAGYVYEYALSLKANANKGELQWQDGPKFENLNPGTIYYVYMRVKAQDGSYAHGVAFCKAYTTYHDLYVEEKVTQLLALKKDTDGDLVNQLIDNAIAQVRAQEPSATFYSDLEEICNRAAIEIEFARRQDTHIATLKKLRDTLVATQCYNEDGIHALNTLCNAAVDNITSATTAEAVQSIFDTAYKAMYEVKISYLRDGDMELTSIVGLKQGLLLKLLRLEELGALTSSVDTAVNLGKVTVGGVNVTLADAIKDLRTKDVLAAYAMKLLNGDSVVTNYEGGFIFRLLLPEELRGVNGLQVAYYNEKTGELEVLDTEVDGNCIVFTANRIANFVILGDTTLDMTGVIGSLGTILLLQLIAIVLLLVRRTKNAKQVRHYGVVPAMFLAIHVLPDQALTWVLVLGALVAVFQVILMYLLLTSDLIPHRKEKKSKQVIVKDVPAMAAADLDAEDQESSDTDVEALDDGDQYQVLDEEDPLRMYDEYLSEEDVADEADVEESEVYGEDDALIYEEEEDGQLAYAGESASDEDAMDELFDETGDEAEEVPQELEDDFIEPAANPRYSLPDEDVYGEAEDAVASDDEVMDEQQDAPAFEAFEDDGAPVDADMLEEEYFDDAPEFEADPGDEDLVEEDLASDEEALAQGDAVAFSYDDEDLATGAPAYDEEVPLEEEELRKAELYEETEDSDPA